MRSPTQRALLTALTAVLAAAAATAWWTADQWRPHAGPWMEQAWKKLTRPGADTLPPDKQRPAQARPAPSGSSAPVAPPTRKCLRDGRTTYTDQPCPPGSQEQSVDGAVTILPATR